jgi:acetate kinase
MWSADTSTLRGCDAGTGFTPTTGLVMSACSGDPEGGVAPFLARTEQIATKQFYELLNPRPGLRVP